MARILGQAGRYVADESVTKKRHILIIVLAMIAVCGAIEGIVIASYLPPMPFNSWLRGIIFSFLLILLVSLSKWANNKVADLEHEQKIMSVAHRGKMQLPMNWPVSRIHSVCCTTSRRRLAIWTM